MIAQAGFHRWRNAQSLMNSDVIAIHEMNGDCVGVIVDLLGEPICQSREAAHIHSHREVLPLDIAGAYMFWVGVSTHGLHVASDADRRRIASFVLKGSPINLVQLCIVNIHTEGILHRFQVRFVPVSSDLDTPMDATGGVFHKVHCPIGTPTADEITNDKLCVGVNSDPCPNVTPSDFLFRGADILGFCADICPYFVTLETTNADLANMLVVVLHAGLAEIDEQSGNSISSNSRHSRCRVDAIAFDQSRDDPNPLLFAQRVHIEHYA